MTIDTEARFSEESILRVSGEPCLYVSEMEVHDRLSRHPVEYYKHVRDRLVRIANGDATMEMPSKMIFSDENFSGDFRVMPCVVRDAGSVTKSVKLVGTNVVQKHVPSQITVGKAFLIDNEENFITHIFEACLLSSARTAICACLAMELLSGSRKRISVVGAGRVGYYCAFYSLALGFAQEVAISDMDIDRAAETAAVLNDKFPRNKTSILPYDRLADTDVLVLATTSTSMVYSPEHFRAGLVISVGADIGYQHELSPELAKVPEIYVDTMDCARYGDLKLWLDRELMTQEKIIDLYTLLRGSKREVDRDCNVFISTGSGIFDNLTMAYIVGGDARQ